MDNHDIQRLIMGERATAIRRASKAMDELADRFKRIRMDFEGCRPVLTSIKTEVAELAELIGAYNAATEILDLIAK
jgi:hypothetical protein